MVNKNEVLAIIDMLLYSLNSQAPFDQLPPERQQSIVHDIKLLGIVRASIEAL